MVSCAEVSDAPTTVQGIRMATHRLQADLAQASMADTRRTTNMIHEENHDQRKIEISISTFEYHDIDHDHTVIKHDITE